MVVPYIKGLSESFKTICGKMRMQVHSEGGNIIRSLLVAPKDKDAVTKKSGVVLRFRCDRLGCGEEYIGESAGVFRERLKGYFRAPSPTYDHANTTGHHTKLDNFSTVGSLTTLQGPSRRTCTSGSMIHPSKEH